MKVECGSIHAIALPGGLRAVVKDVAEMAAAPAAMHFRAGHEETAVRLCLDRLLDRRRETRPPGSAIELGIGGEQRLAATGAVVDALAVLLVERARTGAFGSVLAQPDTAQETACAATPPRSTRLRIPSPPHVFGRRGDPIDPLP